jgi:hypothetical protein
MCFSAEASFAGSAVITAIGVATLTKVKKRNQIPFAVIPLIFGIQQCAEGVLWITLKSGAAESLQRAATLIFLITALVIWPTMIPFSIRLLEKGPTRKKFLAVLVAIGGVVSLLYAFCLIFYKVYPQIQSFHIIYFDEFPGRLVWIAFALYLAATILPLFVSSIKRMWIFGVLIAVSCLVAWIFYAQYLTSIWCFFAALISIAIFWIMKDLQDKTNPEEKLSKEQS